MAEALRKAGGRCASTAAAQLEHAKVYQALEGAPDRVVAIVCGALLERALENGIATRLRVLKRNRYKEIFDTGGVLIGFQAKIRMAYALNLFGEATYAELNLIREIRNVFAHAAHGVRFSTPRIARHCSKLKLPQAKPLPIIYILLGWLDAHAPKHEVLAIKPPDTARSRYIYATVLLEGLLGSPGPAPRPRRGRSFLARRYLR